MKILGIETSCDETAICLVDAKGAFLQSDFEAQVLGNALYSQIAVHAQYGGVYPNLAKREHIHNLVPMLTQCLQQTQVAEGSCDQKGIITPLLARTYQLSTIQSILARESELFDQLKIFLETHERPDIDAIAVTYGPGLEPALWVGVNFAKALSLAWSVPIVAVNHMEGHSIISTLEKTGEIFRLKRITFPMLSLLISGGHTELVLSRSWMRYQIVGQTLDDAVGEAFDKVARLLGLPYPGGPEISRLANQSRSQSIPKGLAGKVSPFLPDLSEIVLPRPMLKDNTLNFSFSGLKSAVRRLVDELSKKIKETNATMSDGHDDSKIILPSEFNNTKTVSERPLLSDKVVMDIAREFEDAVTEVLVSKTLKAVEQYQVETVVVGGGVSANAHIRASLRDALDHNTQALFPEPSLATDNAIMIAMAGYFKAIKSEYADAVTLKAEGNLKLQSDI